MNDFIKKKHVIQKYIWSIIQTKKTASNHVYVSPTKL